MQSSNNDQFDVKLQVTFPKSSEDHRLQLVRINGSIFAILHSSLESNGPINLLCEDWSLVLLAPIKSKTNIVISAINVICLNEIESKEGIVNIQASNRLVKLTPSIKPFEKVYETAKRPVFQLDDPAALLNCFQLFNKVVKGSREGSANSFFEAQQNFITVLCLLAEKIEGKTAQLNIQPVLKIWDIPGITEDGEFRQNQSK
jgi:hypothetical protein